MNEAATIKRAENSDLQILNDLADLLETPKVDEYFETCLAAQAEGQREIFLILFQNEAAGYVIFNRAPRYSLYKRLNIPEIQDLNTVPAFRQRGLATQLIRYCEDMARSEGFEQIGISVGLHKSFGAAQRIYCKLGYLPDGYGVTYDREAVHAGELRPIDDLLCLMMVKDL
ncbi:MAG TPA: GNAT family N-acetyltransferase [Micavibrio sp.]|nr:GNAT family N-acetyltransferase [Micavibrio sp.]HIL28052.1 GNAT family N-acetyltransferase [Micavibrio sp.]